MYLIPPGLILLGAIAYQRGWSLRRSRRSIYEGLRQQVENARRRFSADPNMTNRIDVDRCELNAMYEGQRGRARRRLGIILIVLGLLFALMHV
jgi:hypothetical protein